MSRGILSNSMAHVSVMAIVIVERCRGKLAE